MNAAGETGCAELSKLTGLDLTIFRSEHVIARVERGMRRCGAETLEEYVELVAEHPTQRGELRRSIAISVTGFFRDVEQFELLAPYLERLQDTAVPRVWSAGCSDGSELWTTAAILDRYGLAERSQLLGSDLLEENIVQAQLGPDRAAIKASTGISLPTAYPRFEVRDIAGQGAPEGSWDVVICRNLAIYLAPAVRVALHRTLTTVLARGGLLLLGRSERLADPASLGVERVGPHLYRRPS